MRFLDHHSRPRLATDVPVPPDSGRLPRQLRDTLLASLGLLALLGGTVQAQSATPASKGRSTRLQEAAPLGGSKTLSAAQWSEHLRSMWLGQSMANWTGLVTEGQRIDPPFFTDDDWGTVAGNPTQNGGLIDFVIQTPWLADDDTDIEYIYLDAMTEAQSALLSAEQIQAAWLDHIAPWTYVWVSNLNAHNLMRDHPTTLPGNTSLPASNSLAWMIDAQLTTEIFGAVAPGDPVRALELADLPIRTTATGYAAHAAQFHVALYSLAAVVDPQLSRPEQILWLVETARQLLPSTSKTTDIVDFCLEQYASIPDVNDWEIARDALYQRYQEDDAENGFKYLNWFESPINFGAGLIALLFGEGDYRRTVQIGTLSGWDSDNGTATMGGLLGLLYGPVALQEAFPDFELSDYYDIQRTRIGFSPPFCPEWWPHCLDTFTAMSERMFPRLVEQVVEGGGKLEGDTLQLAAIEYEDLSWEQNPLFARHHSSGNLLLHEFGTAIEMSFEESSLFQPGASGEGTEVYDGLEFDFSGTDRQISGNGKRYVAVQLAPGSSELVIQLNWTASLFAAGVRFVEGPRGFTYQQNSYPSGFETVLAEVLVYDKWVPIQSTPTPISSSDEDYQVFEWILDKPQPISGVRLRGVPIASGFVTVSELEALIQ